MLRRGRIADGIAGAMKLLSDDRTDVHEFPKFDLVLCETVSYEEDPGIDAGTENGREFAGGGRLITG